MCTCFVHAYNYSFVGMYLHSNIHTPNYEHVIHARIRTHIHAYTYIICGEWWRIDRDDDLHLQLPVAFRRVNFDIVSIAVVGSASEKLMM